eukprot:54157-Eustigmatos_ZCMA.PRE.1
MDSMHVRRWTHRDQPYGLSAHVAALSHSSRVFCKYMDPRFLLAQLHARTRGWARGPSPTRAQAIS